MSVEKKYLLWFFVMFLAGSSVGFLVGGFGGSHFGMALVFNNALQQDALETNARIDALRQLRLGNSSEAIELLEASIDDTLVVFDPAEPYPGLNQTTLTAVDRAIENAFEYRRDYPRSSSRPHVDEMVQNLFARRNLTQ